MVIKALLEGSIAGVGKHHLTPIFPCSIFQLMKGVNRKPGDPNYDLFQLALKSTALRLYPNYANCDVGMQADWVEYDRKIKEEVINNLSDDEYASLINRLETTPELKDILMLDVVDMKKIVVRKSQTPFEIMSTMGCRTQNGADVNAKESYFENIKSVISHNKIVNDIYSASMKDGRGNICPVTIIMPTLAMMAKETAESEGIDIVESFFNILDKKIHEAKDMLLERFDHICSQGADSAKFMYENGTMGGYVPSEGIRSALKHGTIVIGQLGLAETLQILIGCDHTTKEGMELAKRIEQLFKDRCAEFKKTYSLNFGVYYTPAENLCYTAMKKFKDKYGEIPNVSDRDYFTNSIHVPVWHEMSAFDKIDIESQLTGYSSAGCITYVELDSGIKNNLGAMEQIVNYAMEHDIPYFAINVPNDSCLDCGYTDEFNDHCPECGSKHIRQLRRVTGLS